MLKAITQVGAIAGLLTTAFVIWDRWVRGRPLAWVTAEKSVKSGANSISYLRLQNPGPADVFIKGVRAYPPIYGLLKNQSPDEVGEAIGAIDKGDVKATTDVDVNVLLWQGKTHNLPIFELPEKDARRFCFLIFWRKTSSTWLPQAPVVVLTSTRDIKDIAAAVAAQPARVP